MIPWLWLWSPNVHFPLSGGVAQHIEPNTNWFFDAITPESGIGQLEKKAFEVASYGTQLGLLNDLVLELAEADGSRLIKSQEAKDSLGRLQAICKEIKEMKEREFDTTAKNVVDDIRRLSKYNKTEYRAFLWQLEKFLHQAKEDEKNSSRNED